MMCIKASISRKNARFSFSYACVYAHQRFARYACELCLCLRCSEDQAEWNSERKLNYCSVTFTLSYITWYIRQLYIIELQFRLYSSLPVFTGVLALSIILLLNYMS